METYDIVMVVVLATATIFGAWKGLAWQVAALSSIFVSYFVALRFRDPVSGLISAEPPWNVFLAMLIVYLAASLAIWLLFGMVRGLIERVRLREFDRQVGALLGLATGVLACVLITLFSVALASDRTKESICRSRAGFYIARLLDRADAVMPEEIHEVVGPYLDRLDEELDGQPTARDFGPMPASIPGSDE